MLSRRYLKLALGLALLCSGTSSVFAAPGGFIGDANLFGEGDTPSIDGEGFINTDGVSGSDVPCIAYELTMSATGTWWAGIFEKTAAEKFIDDLDNDVYKDFASANAAAKSLALSGSTCEFTTSKKCSQTHNLGSGVTYVAAIVNPSASTPVDVTELTVKECTAEQAAAASGASAITAVSAAILATVGALAL